MKEPSKNWVERRAIFEADVPKYWANLCVAIRDAVNTFDGRYAFEYGFNRIEHYTKNGCFHVDLEPREPSKAGCPSPRSLDICLNQSRREIIAHVNGNPTLTLRLTDGTDGTAEIPNEKGEPLTLDQLSRLLLETFLFLE